MMEMEIRNNDLVMIEKGYTVIYDTAKGEIGFIGYDTHSGGYPYFSSLLDTKHLYPNISQAFGLLDSARKMTTYYGKENVHFGTMRVVKYTQVFQEVDETEEKALLENTLGKLSEKEIAVLKRSWGVKK
jgi:hypothetical protein